MAKSLLPESVSPLSGDDFAAHSIEAIVAFLKSWRPQTEPVRQTVSALGQQLQTAVQQSPERFIASAEQLAVLRPIYVRRILEGLDTPARSSKGFSWDNALALIESTISRVSVRGLARVHAEARSMWDVVVERARSIEELREEPIYARNIHLDVLSKIIDETESEAERLGLEICKAMVLATQSEDDKLEAYAYQRFKRFLWRTGEEPREFYAHDDVAAE